VSGILAVGRITKQDRRRWSGAIRIDLVVQTLIAVSNRAFVIFLVVLVLLSLALAIMLVI